MATQFNKHLNADSAIWTKPSPISADYTMILVGGYFVAQETTQEQDTQDNARKMESQWEIAASKAHRAGDNAGARAAKFVARLYHTQNSA